MLRGVVTQTDVVHQVAEGADLEGAVTQLIGARVPLTADGEMVVCCPLHGTATPQRLCIGLWSFYVWTTTPSAAKVKVVMCVML
jgi:hypothetical protein